MAKTKSKRKLNQIKLKDLNLTSKGKATFQSMILQLDAVKSSRKGSDKVEVRYERAVKAIRRYLKEVSLEDQVEKPAKKVKSEKKKAVKTKKPKAVKKLEKPATENHTAPLLKTDTNDKGNIVHLRNADLLIGEIEEKKPSKNEALTTTLDAPRGEKDDLKMIAGVGPKLEELLNGLGVFHFWQIEEWKRNEIDWVDNYLQFTGRIQRDNWVEQAKALAKGGRDEYVKIFGKEPR